MVKELSAQAREFGVRVTRTWSHLATHYLLEQVPEHENGVPAVYPIEMLCGLLNGSHFVTTSWLKEFLGKAKLPRGSGNLEEEYNPPKAEEYKPSGLLSELWQPSDSRQGLFKDVNFVVLYDGSEVRVVSATSFHRELHSFSPSLKSTSMLLLPQGAGACKHTPSVLTKPQTLLRSGPDTFGRLARKRAPMPK